MLKRFSKFCTYLLLLLLPLQSTASSNMLACNSMMLHESVENTQVMPCHGHKNDIAVEKNNHQSHQDTHSCKMQCAIVCASLCTLVALTTTSINVHMPIIQTVMHLPSQPFYTSITLPNFQRPPIFLI